MIDFDRDGNISKLVGCSTRGVDFYWKIFIPFLDSLDKGARILDVGCGDLVESHYLTHQGFRVVGIDLEAEHLEIRRARRAWRGAFEPEFKAMDVNDLSEEEGRFALITAFDVLEHLPDVERTLDALIEGLEPGGFVFLTVPNKRASSEIYSKWLLRGMRRLGRTPPAGVPHLQFKDPEEWRALFEARGFEVLGWDMQIGPLVNTWNLLFQAPSQLGLMGAEVLGIIDRATRHRLHARRPQAPLPAAFRWLDERLKPLTEGLFTWNLAVLRRPT